MKYVIVRDGQVVFDFKIQATGVQQVRLRNAIAVSKKSQISMFADKETAEAYCKIFEDAEGGGFEVKPTKDFVTFREVRRVLFEDEDLGLNKEQIAEIIPEDVVYVRFAEPKKEEPDPPKKVAPKKETK